MIEKKNLRSSTPRPSPYKSRCFGARPLALSPTNAKFTLWFLYRRSILNPNGSYIHTAVSEHFLSSNHSHKDMLLIPLKLLKSKCDSVRKAREAHLIQKAKTVEPLGMNWRNEQWYSYLKVIIFILSDIIYLPFHHLKWLISVCYFFNL